MKGKNLVVKASLLLTAVLLAAGMANKGSKAAYGDVIAKPGQSEVVIENTLHAPVDIFIDGKIEGQVKARDVSRLVVADGNHYIRVRSTAKNGGTSREVQFYTRAKRFVFRVTGPNNFTVSLTRDNAYDITVPNTAEPLAAEPQDVPLAETALGKDKAAMFERLDNQAPAPAGASRSNPSAQQPVAATTAPAPAQAVPAAPAPAAAQTKKPQIAVYVTGDKTDGERKTLGTKMLVALVNSGRYVAVERTEDFLGEIDKEHLKQRDNSVDDNQISTLGKQYGVRYICIAHIAEAFGAFQVSARIIDVETAVVVAVGESSSPLRSMDDLSSVSARVVKALLKE